MCGYHYYLVVMDTELLTDRNSSDANAKLTRRIKSIYKVYDDGLGGFFEAVKRARQSEEKSTRILWYVDRMLQSSVIKPSDSQRAKD